jgi:hypothetical protein
MTEYGSQRQRGGSAFQHHSKGQPHLLKTMGWTPPDGIGVPKWRC